MDKKGQVSIKNRKAFHEYEIIDTYVAGIQLYGSEVKAIRDGRVGLGDSYCYFNGGELFAKNMSIQNMDHMVPHDPERPKRLLLNRSELDKLEGDLDQGLTIVVTSVFTSKGRIKAEIALARGKKMYDKRETIKKRDAEREIRRVKQ